MSYGMVDCKCPFWFSDTKTEIACDGYLPEVRIRLTFRKYDEKKYYFKHLCCSNDYEKCDTYKMLCRIQEESK